MVGCDKADCRSLAARGDVYCVKHRMVLNGWIDVGRVNPDKVYEEAATVANRIGRIDWARVVVRVLGRIMGRIIQVAYYAACVLTVWLVGLILLMIYLTPKLAVIQLGISPSCSTEISAGIDKAWPLDSVLHEVRSEMRVQHEWHEPAGK